MTRLTADLVRNIPDELPRIDDRLREGTGMGLRRLASFAVDQADQDNAIGHLTMASVPISTGRGVIPGFSEAVAAIIEHLGFRSFVTKGHDAAGLMEAVEAGANIIFLADDHDFIALNLDSKYVVSNVSSTALGYVCALGKALGGLRNREILIIGAGRVGTVTLNILVGAEARITIVDTDSLIGEIFEKRNPGIRYATDLEREIRRADAILNASPARIPADWVKKRAVISSPGLPYAFDDECRERAAVIIHDPLALSTSVMAMWSAVHSIRPGYVPRLMRGRFPDEEFVDVPTGPDLDRSRSSVQ
ncbi:MAG: 3-methylornithyl-N6-L-lysine dehydrogenase PylD [Methanomassiliicoccus sp.]|nr:MAG: 3-methylornithyl-N6-L-lysine dehydrogenase PylD [Methanomassiliicoccus sp.]